MAFDSFASFISMGGHGLYVWLSWGVSLLLLLAVVWHARIERRRLLVDLKRRVRREKVRQGQGGDAESKVYSVDQGESS